MKTNMTKPPLFHIPIDRRRFFKSMALVSAGFTLPNGAVRAPDACWVARGHWEVVPPEDQKKFTRICPDFVVEITSPSDTRVIISTGLTRANTLRRVSRCQS